MLDGIKIIIGSKVGYGILSARMCTLTTGNGKADIMQRWIDNMQFTHEFT